MTQRQKPTWFDWGLGVLTIVGGGTAIRLYTVVIPASGSFGHLQHAEQRLPFVVHFALTPGAGTVASLVALALLVAAVITRRVAWASVSRIFLLSAATTPLVVMGIGLAGIRVADATCVFAPGPGLVRCSCPGDAFPTPLECHCDAADNLRELLLAGDDVEEWPAAQRLFAGGDPRIERFVVRDTIRIEGNLAVGETLSIEGDARKVTCNYPEPCQRLRLGVCGPCRAEAP